MDPRRPAADSAADRWAPVVVGRPVAEFAPAPPGPWLHHTDVLGGYRPDTVCDGWSTGALTVRLASVRGYSHRYERTPRQDDAVVVAHPPTGAVAFAVADGVSGAAQSHLGATLACQLAVAGVLDALDDGRPIDWPTLFAGTGHQLVAYAQDLLGLSAPEPAQAIALLATALVAGVVHPPGQLGDGATAALARIGDSGGWLLGAGTFHDAFGADGDAAAAEPVRTSAVLALPSAAADVAPAVRDFPVPPDAVLLVGTDGFGVPLGKGSGLVGHLFAGTLARRPTALELAHTLDFSRETFDDDRTLLAIWPDPEPR